MLIIMHFKTEAWSYVIEFSDLTCVIKEIEELHNEGSEYMCETVTN